MVNTPITVLTKIPFWKKWEKNAVINWTKLATKYHHKSLKSNDAPGNGGQVLMHFAKDNGI